jgi:hypothetical protein
MRYRVSNKATQGLFLRSAPRADGDTKVAVMPVGTRFDFLSEAIAGWVFGTAFLDGSQVQGFASLKYLEPEQDVRIPFQSALAVNLDPVNRLVTRNNRLLAYRLNEPDMPLREPMDTPEDKVEAINRIIKYLKVDTSNRYHPNPSNTYCNIYGTDYCYLGGVYLPRVWWLTQAYIKIKQGQGVPVSYGQTVAEVNANGLLTWLKEHGSEFGWVRCFDLDQMQNSANEGLICIIVAQQKIPNRSGHICAVVPESKEPGGFKAVRANGKVVRPLQSQAGRTNKQHWMPPQWWTAPNYREFGFWINSH